MPIKSDLNMIVAVTDLLEFSRFSLVISPVPMSSCKKYIKDFLRLK
jgi:hypothetical protein